MEAQGKDYLSIFANLTKCGYKEAIIFDNFICVLTLHDTRNLTLLRNISRIQSKIFIIMMCYFLEKILVRMSL